MGVESWVTETDAGHLRTSGGQQRTVHKKRRRIYSDGVRVCLTHLINNDVMCHYVPVCTTLETARGITQKK